MNRLRGAAFLLEADFFFGADFFLEATLDLSLTPKLKRHLVYPFPSRDARHARQENRFQSSVHTRLAANVVGTPS